MLETYDYLIKAAVVGDEKTGKSKLTQLLCQGDNYEFSAIYEQTIGVDFGAYHFSASGKEFKLQMWDTAGNQLFQKITQSYYPSRELFLLCFDQTNKQSLQQLNGFIQPIRLKGADNARLILVGTKGDDTSNIQVKEKDITNFKEDNNLSDVPVILTSAKNHNGIEQLRNQISEAASSVVNLKKTKPIIKVKQPETRCFNTHSQTSPGLFKPMETKAALAVGTVAGAAAITIAALACTGVLTLNPVAFGLAVGLLTALSVGSLFYFGIKACQNHTNDNKGST